MKLLIKTRHLKGAKYGSNEDCPIARALKEAGYRKVHVGGYTGGGVKGGKPFNFSIPNASRVSSRICKAVELKRPSPFLVTLEPVS
jgi:hypothetical protein